MIKETLALGTLVTLSLGGTYAALQAKPIPQKEAQPESTMLYTVKSGDTAWSIARKYCLLEDGSLRIQGVIDQFKVFKDGKFVPLKSPDELDIGQTLRIPSYHLGNKIDVQY